MLLLTAAVASAEPLGQDLSTEIESLRSALAASTLDESQPQAATAQLDAAAAELKKLRGVGQWTADIYLVTCLGRCDAWPAGDLAVRAGVQLFEQLADVPSIPDMDAHGERWRPWRAVAACYLWGLYASDRRRDVGI